MARSRAQRQNGEGRTLRGYSLSALHRSRGMSAPTVSAECREVVNGPSDFTRSQHGRDTGPSRFRLSWRGYDCICIPLGAILLAAAALKADQLATNPIPGTGLLDA